MKGGYVVTLPLHQHFFAMVAKGVIARVARHVA
jgi:hypothetical protein